MPSSRDPRNRATLPQGLGQCGSQLSTANSQPAIDAAAVDDEAPLLGADARPRRRSPPGAQFSPPARDASGAELPAEPPARYRGRELDPHRFAAYEREMETKEIAARIRPSPFLHGHSGLLTEHPAIAADDAWGPRTDPAGADALVMKEEHREVVRRLAEEHADEIRRSDAVHARHCNDLIAQLEAALAERDAQQEQSAAVVGEVEELECAGGDLQQLRRRRERASAAARAAAERRAELRREVAALREENDTLRYEAERVYSITQRRDGDAARALSHIQAETAGVHAACAELSERLRHGTADFRGLDDSHQELEQQALLGEARVRDAGEELARRDSARELVEQQLAELLALCQEAQRRAAAAEEKAPPPPPRGQAARKGAGGKAPPPAPPPRGKRVCADLAQQDLLQVAQAAVRLTQLLHANRT